LITCGKFSTVKQISNRNSNTTKVKKGGQQMLPLLNKTSHG